MQSNLCREGQKIARICTRHVGHASNLALTPKQFIVVELRNAVEMNRVDRNHSAFPQARKRSHDHVAGRREGHRAIEFNGRLFGLVSHPCGSQRLSELAMRLSSSRNINFAIPRLKHLDRKVRRRAEAEQTNAFSSLNPGYSQASETNDAGAKQGCSV